ncbi:YceI family protein [Roseibium hamelinense]|nr:YceI family protein [Roseibium hamelinense]
MNNLLAAAVAAPMVLTSASAIADTWNVNHEDSTLGFVVQQGEGTVTGTFGDWTASIEFDPEQLETAVITAQIRTPTASTGNTQLDGMLPTADFFDINEFPVAEFTAENVTLVGGNQYKADGSLIIKGISQPVELTFTLDIDGDTAKANGEASISRQAYNVGKTVKTDALADTVKVTLDLTAIR